MIFTFNPQSRSNNHPWEESDDSLWLLTPDELASLPDGIQLTSISGEQITTGVDDIDGDTRFGYLAVGLLESQILAPKDKE